MRNLDQRVLALPGNPQALEDFIREYENYIRKQASLASHRYITPSDDEWSVALSAFSEAVHKYDFDKGAFLPFAELVIKRRLADYFRSQSRKGEEISLEEVEEPAYEDSRGSDLPLEIEALGQVLDNYGFRFMDLPECSPKAEKTKIACAAAITYLAGHKEILDEMRNQRQLPIKKIENCTGLPRKIMERHRKYIIAATEIVAGEYPHLQSYLEKMLKGVEK